MRGAVLGPILIGSLALVLAGCSRQLPRRADRMLLPVLSAVAFLCAWHLACRAASTRIFPTPSATLEGMLHLFRDGTVFRYVVASLFRVGCGFGLAAGLGIPLGLWAGWSLRMFQAINPIVQGLRPISPIAWLPVAILWFGVGDAAAIFVIFLAALFPIVTGSVAAVRSIPIVYVRSAQNLGVRGWALARCVLLPAALPQIVTSLRLALGIAWMVVVAAEMLGVSSGLGYLVNDARNMGMRYDLVVGAMVCIALIGIGLDVAVRRLERLDQVRWGFSKV